jgi:hypothetical protein
MTQLPDITKIPKWLASDAGLAEMLECCKAAESAALIYSNALRSNTLSPALCDDVVARVEDIRARLDAARRRPLPSLYALFTRAEAARHPRRPTLASVAKQASKAAIPVARYEVKPDGTVVVVPGEPSAAATGSDEWDEALDRHGKH